MTITRIAHPILLAFGWRRATIALAAGAVSSLAMAPFDLWPILFLTFPILVWLTDGAAAGRLGAVPSAALAGWFFGFGYFLAGLYWIGNAFLVDAKIFGWLLPIAVTGLPAMLALFPAFGLALARLMWTRGYVRVLALAVALTVSEWLRGYLFTGFPWNAYGYALTGPLVLAQSAALFGLWGLTFLAVTIFAAPAVFADDPADTKRRWLPTALGVLALAALAIHGALRLARTPSSFVDGVHLRIMQPNLQQNEKFNYSAKQEIMKRYIALSDRASGPGAVGLSDVTHLIWPESAFPFFLAREPEAMAQIAAMLPAGTVLITGAARPVAITADRSLRAYNSIYVIDHDGSILTVYDKVHLVPFGEYLPFQTLLEKLNLIPLTKVKGGFLSGDRHRTYSIPRAPRFLPLICYEIIFPSEAIPAADRPDWLLNVTNDGWFGLSTGPHQHFQQARVRAIEQGLPLVRAANTGISAVVDPVGRIITSLPLGTEGILDAPLPRQIAPPFYARTGDGLVALFLGVVAMVVIRRRNLR